MARTRGKVVRFWTDLKTMGIGKSPEGPPNCHPSSEGTSSAEYGEEDRGSVLHKMNFQCLKYPRSISVNLFPLGVLHPGSPSTNESLVPTRRCLGCQTFTSSPDVSPRMPWSLAPQLGVRMCLASPCQLRTTRGSWWEGALAFSHQKLSLSPDYP